MKGFAYYLSDSEEVAGITQKMWRVRYPFPSPSLTSPSFPISSYDIHPTVSHTKQNIDWCYIFYATSFQFSAILLATVPRWYLYQALGSNFLWMLPWAIVMTIKKFEEAKAWTFYAVIFGGALVFDFFNVGLVLGVWGWCLLKGKMRVRPVGRNL